MNSATATGKSRNNVGSSSVNGGILNAPSPRTPRNNPLVNAGRSDCPSAHLLSSNSPSKRKRSNHQPTTTRLHDQTSPRNKTPRLDDVTVADVDKARQNDRGRFLPKWINKIPAAARPAIKMLHGDPG